MPEELENSIKDYADLALSIFYGQCQGSFNCGFGFGHFASKSLFLELSDNEITDVLDYCVDEGYFKLIENTYWITFKGKIRLQQIFEHIGTIKMIYYETNHINLSDRLLLYLNELESSIDVGNFYIVFNNFNEQEIILEIQSLIDDGFVKIVDDDRLFGINENYSHIYSLFGFKRLAITLNGRRKAHQLLKDPDILALYKLPILEDEKRFELIEKISESLRRFHLSTNWLEKHRRQNHDPFIIKDEYDVQDLLYSFLLMNFPEVDMENPGKKIADVSIRQDIIIQNLKLIIEIKCFRNGDDWPAMKQSINNKIQSYSRVGDYDYIIVFIYNPDLVLKKPDIIERDLTTSQRINDSEFDVLGIVDPK